MTLNILMLHHQTFYKKQKDVIESFIIKQHMKLDV